MISAIIAMLIGYLEERARLKQCLLVNIKERIEMFEHKGKRYDSNRYNQKKRDAFASLNKRNLAKIISDLEIEEKNSEYRYAQLKAAKEAYQKY